MSDMEQTQNWNDFVFSSSVEESETVRLFKSRLLTLITVFTGLLMWTYSFIALLLVEREELAYIGFACSMVHALAPLVGKWTKSICSGAYCMVVPGMIFQFSFSFFTGGFFAPTLIWFAVLPLIMGILTNKAHAALWIFITALGFLGMYYLHASGYVPESSLTPLGQTVAQFMIGLGLIGLVGGFTIFFLELSYFYHGKSKGS